MSKVQTYPKQYLYKRIVQAKLYIDQHFSENLDLDNIADEALFSKFHFIRLFKKIYGYTPHQYLTIVRINNAKLMLGSDVLISAVCADIGFESLSTFTALFRKHTGINPSDFQKQALKKRSIIEEQPLRYIPNCFAQQNGWNKE